MKKTLQSLGFAAALTFGVNASAQLPDYGVYPGGLMLDEFGPGGDIWDVDSILDSGTPVLIDMFAVWCGPCWTYHTGGTLEDLYASSGWGGTGDVAIFGVESDPGYAEDLMDGGTGSQGDWVTGIDYPMINHNGIASMMNLAYYPTLILICPDRKVTEVGQVSEAAWQTAIGNCGALSASANDLRLVSNETVTSVVSCAGATINQTYQVAVQNYSNVNVSGMKTFQIMDGMTAVGTANVNVNLDPYEAELITIGPVPLSTGANPFNAIIATADTDLSNNQIATPVTVTNAAVVGTGDLVLHITTDAYAVEMGVALASGSPYQTSQSAAYNACVGGSYTGLIDFHPYGTWAGSGSGQGAVHHIDWYDLPAGCYHFIMFDDYGDGLLGDNQVVGGTGINSDGTITLESESGYNGSIPVNYGDWGTYAFEVTTAGDGGFTGIENAQSVETASVYPNPASDMTNIEFNVTTASDVTIQVVNALGQVIYNNNMGEVNGAQKVTLNTVDFEAGMYLINITVNGDVLTKRVSVIK